MKAATVSAVPSERGVPELPEERVEEMADEIIEQMTLDEKLDMIHGKGFSIAAVERLGITEINMSDASLGLRVTPWPTCKGLEPSTAFPASLLLSATWDPELAGRYATAVAEEFRARNMHVLLGPGINIYRNPLCGRNYEYMGEDPFLASLMVVPYVKAVRQVGCIPVVKHFAANNADIKRQHANSVVEERALREIYFPAFNAAVMEGEALGIMNAYNLLNGTYCGENRWLLKDVLRGEWGFRGMVVSDWTSLWNGELAVNSGVDIEMPGGEDSFILSPDKIRQLLAEGKTTQEEIDSKVANLIHPCLEMGMYSSDWKKPELNKLEEHAQVALDTAREGMVLLKNQKELLPLEPRSIKKIVVIGPTARKTPTTGGGSGGVLPENPVSIWDGIKAIYGDKAELLDEFDAAKVQNADAVLVCVGLNTGLVLKDYRCEEDEGSIASEQAVFNRLKEGVIESESGDRPTPSLLREQNKLIEQCAAANPRVAVLYTAGGEISMPWIDQVGSLLWLLYPGQNGAQAAAEIVAGRVNPSGRLPITIAEKLEDHAAYGNFGLQWDNNGPAKKAGIRDYWDVIYKEGIFVGYRHFDQARIKPLFPFGHGLGYTTFDYRALSVRQAENGTVRVAVVVKNTGRRAGKETIQLYVGDVEASAPRPPKELKGFKKIELAPGESKTVRFELGKAAFSFWSPNARAWVSEPGDFDVFVGASSRDIRQTRRIKLSF